MLWNTHCMDTDKRKRKKHKQMTKYVDWIELALSAYWIVGNHFPAPRPPSFSILRMHVSLEHWILEKDFDIGYYYTNYNSGAIVDNWKYALDSEHMFCCIHLTMVTRYAALFSEAFTAIVPVCMRSEFFHTHHSCVPLLGNLKWIGLFYIRQYQKESDCCLVCTGLFGFISSQPLS